MEVVLGIPFITFSNTDFKFAEKDHTWRTYITKKALPSIHQVKFINQKQFAKAVLDENIKPFVVHVSSLK